MRKLTWIIVLLCVIAIAAYRVIRMENRSKGSIAQTTQIQTQTPQVQLRANTSSLIHINSTADFNSKVLSSNKVALVDFYADWCPPCRKLSPIIEKIASESNGKYIVAKINIDKNRELAQKYVVRSIPTVLIIKNGKEVNRIIGYSTEKTYQDAIKAAQ